MTAEVVENDVLADAVERAAVPAEISNGLSTVVVKEDHKIVVIDNEATLAAPLRKIGSVEFYDHASLASYVNHHKTPSTVLYADDRTDSITAVINDPGDDSAGWGDHTAKLTIRKTREWTNWVNANDKFMSQADFAEHIERHLLDIVEPPGADMLELAQTFEATTKVAFRQSRLLANGQRQFEYVEDIDASGGKKGELIIPKEFSLGISPFDGVDPYKVTARLRYRIEDTKLRLSYVLINPEDVETEAFKHLAEEVSTATETEILLGKVSKRYEAQILRTRSASNF